MNNRPLARRINKVPRGIVAIGLSSSVVLTTALLGLVVEDFLPHEAGEPSVDLGHFTAVRLILSGVCILTLAGLAWLVSAQRQTNGTLYYVRILDERAPDLHAEANRHSRKRSLDYRSVTRALDLGTGRAVDVADVIADARADLERAAATDDPQTAFELAPNAHWPIEFALGYEWPLPDDSTLIELDRDSSTPSFSVSAEPGPVAPIDPPTALDRGARLVHLDIHLSNGALLTENKLREMDEQLFGRTADAYLTVGWGEHGAVRNGERARVSVGSGGIDPRESAALVATAILEALDRYPYASVAVTVNTTKAVGVLAGRYLAAQLRAPASTPEQSRHWISPWTRLCLVARSTTNFKAETSGQAQIMRVHPSQPTMPPWWPPVPTDGTIVNLTPHDLAVYDGEQVGLAAPRTTVPARIREVRSDPYSVTLNGTATPVVDLSYADDVTGLPQPVDGTWYVVSRITAQALRHRADLLFPIDEVRNDSAQIVGCRALGRFVDLTGT